MHKQVDVLVIGGGLIGGALMLALQKLGLNALLVESTPFSEKVTADFDARSLALSPASQRILHGLDCWTLLKDKATPIESIHISEQYRFGVAHLRTKSSEPLGYVIEMQPINQVLQQLLSPDCLIAPAKLIALNLEDKVAVISTASGELIVKAQLIVAADGANSTVRQLSHFSAKIKSYQQEAIVANIELKNPHQYRAYERFTPEGPLALLPMQGRKMSLVWAMSPAKVAQLLSLDDKRFLEQLQVTFGYRAGRLVKVGKRSMYPLTQVLMAKKTLWPLVFIGNAAHTLHPVAGQGFNLGLRDVASLVHCIAHQGLKPSMLVTYAQFRRHDEQMITRLTDGLIQVFTSRIPGMGFVRNLGLIAFDNHQGLKKLLARYTQGFGGMMPDLICERVLRTEL